MCLGCCVFFFIVQILIVVSYALHGDWDAIGTLFIMMILVGVARVAWDALSGDGR